ncbi:MAG: OsmC family protein [Thermoleophilaceae bacterium]|nr:OsmC family protein [Thermoleophilaceae bacterium]
MAAERTATVTWQGSLARGRGTFSTGSGALGDQEVTWASRTERSEGRTSPEELIAAAHASCLSMALSNILTKGGNEPERLQVQATCTIDAVDGGFKITTIRLDVRGRVPGIDEESFRQAVAQAKDGCPVSGALQGNVEISASATLES